MASFGVLFIEHLLIEPASSGIFTSSFPKRITLISLSCLIAGLRTFNTMMNRSGEIMKLLEKTKAEHFRT